MYDNIGGKNIIEVTEWFIVEKVETSIYLISKKYPINEEEAWEKTFEKWTRIKSFAQNKIKLRLNDSDTCGLCNWYKDKNRLNRPNLSSFCKICPICKVTGSVGCGNTPFGEWNIDNIDSIDNNTHKTDLEIIDKEIGFLKEVYEKKRS